MKYAVLAMNKETLKNEPVIERRTLRSAMYHAECAAQDLGTSAIVMSIAENKLLAKYTEKGTLLIF